MGSTIPNFLVGSLPPGASRPDLPVLADLRLYGGHWIANMKRWRYSTTQAIIPRALGEPSLVSAVTKIHINGT